MTNIPIERREFIKRLGVGAATIGLSHSSSGIIGKTPGGVVVDSPGEFGGFLVEKIADSNFPYEYDPEILKRMSEKSTTFSRNVWDPNRQNRPESGEDIAYLNLVEGKGQIPNQTRLDYALMAASWHTANVHGRASYQWEIHRGMVRGLGLHELGPWDPAELDMTWEEATLAVKHAALFYGASLSGVAVLNPLWLYSDRFSPRKEDRGFAIPVLSEGDRFGMADEALYIPSSMNRVIALAFEEDFYGIANSPGRLASAAVGDGYSRMAFTAATLAEFVRALGYRAIPAGNGIGLSIPMAIDAGLGELGRLGLLITPKYGPRVRLAKVITDMPLLPDPRLSFGVTEFCEACMLCAEECPSSAISKGTRTWQGKSPSNNPGTLKWYIESEKCYDFNGFSCSNCKRVCPFTKPNNSWLHRIVRKTIEGRVKPLNALMVTLDQAGGYGQQLEDRDFWEMDGQKSITARESM
jgi:reductive dehalogenase